ncbi:antimicrobial peptide THP1-like [Strigops habroptila]|uniref:antimicrobial peptide THP1-like n=1 Tax=Strigops habroptila TaxID=2489341 RepID=UPI0011CF399A|nr:antimicrobial peptide THP1-like [Strigops habroptila]
MKILYLLFPLLLLLVQGAAALGKAEKCIQKKGFCVLGGCRFPYKYAGTCSTFSHCCKL